MREFVLVEFLASVPEDSIILSKKLRALGNEFTFVSVNDNEYEIDEDGQAELFFRIVGKISSEYASVIKLQDPFLSDRMRISYISDELKDKYRK